MKKTETIYLNDVGSRVSLPPLGGARACRRDGKLELSEPIDRPCATDGTGVWRAEPPPHTIDGPTAEAAEQER
jgi:hypothetical protein